MDVKLNNNGMPQMQDNAPVAGMTPDAGTLEAEAAKAAQALGNLLDGMNVLVSRANGVEGRQGAHGVTSVPDLDEADLAKAMQADLEVLVAYLQMETDEQMAKTQGDRIDALKGQMKAAHETQMEKIAKSIEEAKKQEKMAKLQKALGWLSAIVAVVSAIVVTIATGGVAVGFAWAGAALAVGSAIMNQTGATQKICSALSEKLREDHPNLSKAQADTIAQAIYAAVEITLSLTCGFVGGKLAGKAAETAAQAGIKAAAKGARVAKILSLVTSSSLGTINLAVSGVSTAVNYKAGKVQADATENQKYLSKIQKFLEECEDDLQTILDQLMQAGADVLELLESKTDTANKITMEIGQQNA